MFNIKQLESIHLHGFLQILKQYPSDKEVLDQIYNFLEQAVKEDSQYVIHCKLLESVTGNGFPGDPDIEFTEQYEFGDEFESDCKEKFVISMEEHLERHTVYRVLDQLKLKPAEAFEAGDDHRRFINNLQAYFYYSTIYSIVEDDNEELLARYIWSFTCSNIKEWEDEMDFLFDEVTGVVRYLFRIEPDDFMDEESMVEIQPYSEESSYIETPFDWVTISREIIDGYI